MRIVIASSWGPFFKFAFCWCFGRIGRTHQSAPIIAIPKPTVLVVGDLVVSVIMEGASVPCKGQEAFDTAIATETSAEEAVSSLRYRISSECPIVPIVHYKLCCTEGTIFTSVGKLLLFFASPWISQHCAFPCTEECGLEPVVLVHPRPPCFGIYVMPIVYAFVVYKVDKDNDFKL